MTLLDTALVAALAAVLAYRRGWTVGATKMSRAMSGQSTRGAIKRWWEARKAHKGETDPACPDCGKPLSEHLSTGYEKTLTWDDYVKGGSSEGSPVEEPDSSTDTPRSFGQYL